MVSGRGGWEAVQRCMASLLMALVSSRIPEMCGFGGTNPLLVSEDGGQILSTKPMNANSLRSSSPMQEKDTKQFGLMHWLMVMFKESCFRVCYSLQYHGIRYEVAILVNQGCGSHSQVQHIEH